MRCIWYLVGYDVGIEAKEPVNPGWALLRPMVSLWPIGRYQTGQGLLRPAKPSATLNITRNIAPEAERGQRSPKAVVSSVTGRNLEE